MEVMEDPHYRLVAPPNCPGIVEDEGLSHHYEPNFLPRSGIVSSKGGRFLIFQWEPEHLRSFSDILCVVDTFFNHRPILFRVEGTSPIRRNVTTRKIIDFNDGRLCVVQRNKQLIGLCLDALTKTAIVLWRLNTRFGGLAHSLEDSGRIFLSPGRTELSVYAMKTDEDLSEPTWREQIIPHRPYFGPDEQILSARLAKSRRNIWLRTNRAIYLFNSEGTPPQRFAYGGWRSPLRELGNWQRYTDFLDSEFLFAVVFTEAPGPMRWCCRLKVIRLDEELGPQVTAQYSLDMQRFFNITNIICDGSALQIRRTPENIVRFLVRRPQSLLVTAHLAAISSRHRSQYAGRWPIAPPTGETVPNERKRPANPMSNVGKKCRRKLL